MENMAARCCQFRVGGCCFWEGFVGGYKFLTIYFKEPHINLVFYICGFGTHGLDSMWVPSQCDQKHLRVTSST